MAFSKKKPIKCKFFINLEIRHILNNTSFLIHAKQVYRCAYLVVVHDLSCRKGLSNCWGKIVCFESQKDPYIKTENI